jgi:hypothetical protein
MQGKSLAGQRNHPPVRTSGCLPTSVLTQAANRRKRAVHSFNRGLNPAGRNEIMRAHRLFAVPVFPVQ